MDNSMDMEFICDNANGPGNKFTAGKTLSMADLMHYEIQSSRWASYISWNWAQELSARYFAKKVKRKYRRYIATRIMMNRVKNQNQ